MRLFVVAVTPHPSSSLLNCHKHKTGTTKAVVIDKVGSPSLIIKEVPHPPPKMGEVVIKAKAFGVNNAELLITPGGLVTLHAGPNCHIGLGPATN